MNDSSLEFSTCIPVAIYLNEIFVYELTVNVLNPNTPSSSFEAVA